MTMTAASRARRDHGGGRVRARHALTGLPSVGEVASLGQGQIAQIQRARIVAGMLDVVWERGAANASVAHVVARSGVSRRTFYEVFEDREDCLLAAFEEALALATERVLPADQAEASWHRKVRAALAGLLGFLDEEPKIARLLVCESLSGGKRTVVRRGEVVSVLTAAIEEGRHESKLDPPLLTGEGTVGAVLSILHSQLELADHEPLITLVNPLMALIVTPYLGFAASRRELEHPVQSAADTTQAPGVSFSDPFKDAGMRLTYRTVRVLIAIAEHPGSSNRLIGDTAEIADQGQISKLLARLLRTGMVTNTGLGPGQGGPNAWTLTPAGRDVVSTVRAYTQDGVRER